MKAIVLSSGGLDSSTCLGLVLEKYQRADVMTISIFYGQRHERELDAASKIARYYGVDHYEFDAASLFVDSNSAMLKSSARSIDHATYSEQMAFNGTKKVSTYVPFRNGLMMSMAASFADGHFDGDDPIKIYIGVHADDAAISAYPDCSVEFIETIDRAIAIGTYDRIHVVAPFVKMNKADVVRIGLDLKVPYDLTWSCYDSGDRPCGKCATCLDRAAAFAANHAIDPLIDK